MAGKQLVHHSFSEGGSTQRKAELGGKLRRMPPMPPKCIHQREHREKQVIKGKNSNVCRKNLQEHSPQRSQSTQRKAITWGGTTQNPKHKTQTWFIHHGDTLRQAPFDKLRAGRAGGEKRRIQSPPNYRSRITDYRLPISPISCFR